LSLSGVFCLNKGRFRFELRGVMELRRFKRKGTYVKWIVWILRNIFWRI
jgi:hypothetical protein